MNIRLKFSRLGPVKYLGHLDMMRYFQKALLRAEIDMKYSEGFNPHQIMSFAYPLGVSMETIGDYLDIEVLSYESLDKIVNDLNSVMNEGIIISKASVVPDNEINAMASVAAASYTIIVSEELTESNINDFVSQSEIVVVKDGKKGPVTKDIKEGIFEIKLKNSNELYLFLQSGSSLNIKPIDVLNAYNSYFGTNVSIKAIVRNDIYRLNSNNALVPLGDF